MFQLQLFLAPLWRMGPRCSSAETQVCRRSYIIAARYNCQGWFSFSYKFLLYPLKYSCFNIFVFPFIIHYNQSFWVIKHYLYLQSIYFMQGSQEKKPKIKLFPFFNFTFYYTDDVFSFSKNQSDKSCSIAAIIDFVSREKNTSYIRNLDWHILYLLILK